MQPPDGQTTSVAYGPTNGRLNNVTFSRGTLSYGYDSAGRISSLSDPGGVTLTYFYDGALPLHELWSGTVNGTVSRSFDNDFGVASESVNFAFGVGFTYDADRLLTGAGALTIARHPQHGLVTSTTLGSTTDTYSYNEFGEPTRQTAVAAGTQVFELQITRDDLGRITQRIEMVDGNTRVFHYGYDLAGRLQIVSRDSIGGPPVTVAAYTYDANGNRLTAQGEAYGGGAPIVATYDDQDRLLTYGGASYTYAANGELATKTVGGQTTSYVYDTLGNLVQMNKPNGQVITYTIDGRGRRVGKSINGVRVKGWLYADQLRLVAELDGNGTVVSRFVYGAKGNVPEYMIRGGATYRIFSDHFGSPRVIVNSATGATAQRMDFQAFGEIIQDSNPGWQPFAFAGGLSDPDSSLVRFGARDFDSQTGQWLARDPLGFTAGDTNLYGYVGNDPINFQDPTGLYSADEFLSDFANAAAGFGDVITSGLGLFDSSLTEMAREALGLNDVVNRCSIAYGAGEIAGRVVGGTALALRGAAAIGGTRLGRALNMNNNRFIRIGPGRMPANGPLPPSTNAPRISIGRGPGNPI